MATQRKKVLLTVTRVSAYQTTDSRAWSTRRDAERQQARLDLIETLKERLAEPHSYESAVEISDHLIRMGDPMVALLRDILRGELDFSSIEPVNTPVAVAEVD